MILKLKEITSTGKENAIIVREIVFVWGNNQYYNQW